MNEKQIENKEMIVDLLAHAYSIGVMATLKNWNYWTRSIPEKQLIPHIDKLARENAEKMLKDILGKQEVTE